MKTSRHVCDVPWIHAFIRTFGEVYKVPWIHAFIRTFEEVYELSQIHAFIKTFRQVYEVPGCGYKYSCICTFFHRDIKTFSHVREVL